MLTWTDVGERLLWKLIILVKPCTFSKGYRKWKCRLHYAAERELMYIGRSDPFVARRILHLVLRFTNFAKPSSRAHHRRSVLSERIKNTMYSIKSALHRSREPNLSDFIKKFITCIPGFLNVCILDIESWPWCFPRTYNFIPLFNAFWPTFGNKLWSLKISASAETYRSVLLSTPVLSSSLKYLCLEFVDHNYLEDRAIEREIISSLVAPFVRSLSAHVESLWILCRGSMWDISSVFIECDSFPYLQDLFISMEVEEGSQNLMGLEKILFNSKSLRRLSTHLFFPSIFPDDSPLSRWYLKYLQEKEYLGQLQDLDLYSEAGWSGLSVILAYIRRTSATLCRLTIRNRYLIQEEISAIIKVATDCPGLRYFAFNICACCFKIQVIDEIAVFLPNLEGLAITLSPSRSDCDHATIWVSPDSSGKDPVNVNLEIRP